MEDTTELARQVCNTLNEFVTLATPTLELTTTAFRAGDVLAGNAHLAQLAESMLLIIQSIHEVALTLPFDNFQSTSIRNDLQVSLEDVNVTFTKLLEARQREDYTTVVEVLDKRLQDFIRHWEQSQLPRLKSYLYGS